MKSLLISLLLVSNSSAAIVSFDFGNFFQSASRGVITKDSSPQDSFGNTVVMHLSSSVRPFWVIVNQNYVRIPSRWFQLGKDLPREFITGNMNLVLTNYIPNYRLDEYGFQKGLATISFYNQSTYLVRGIEFFENPDALDWGWPQDDQYNTVPECPTVAMFIFYLLIFFMRKT